MMKNNINITKLLILILIFNLFSFIFLAREVEARAGSNLDTKSAFIGLVIFTGINYYLNKEDFSLNLPSFNLRSENKYNEIKQSEDNIYWLARLIHAEARGEPAKGQIAVGNVVLNRVLSDEFPNTIYSVIYQRGQFCVVDDGQINLKPNEQALNSAKKAFEKDITYGSLYFYNPLTSSAAGIDWMSTREMKLEIGNHRFRK